MGDHRCLERHGQYHDRTRQVVLLTSQEMALEMLGMEVSLGAVGAWEFAISVLHGNHGVLGTSASGRGSRSSRSAGKDTASSL